MHLPRRSWVWLNRLRTAVGRFRSSLLNWGMTTTAVCKCSAEKQTTDHVTTDCPFYSPPHGIDGLIRLNEELKIHNQLTARNLPVHLTKSSNNQTKEREARN